MVTFCNSSSAEVRLPGTIVQSPNYPDDYDNNVDCVIEIRLSEGEVVSLELLSFHLQEIGMVCDDYLEIKDGLRICGTYNQTTFKSSSNTMQIRFHSDESTTNKGFRIKVETGRAQFRIFYALCYIRKFPLSIAFDIFS